MAVATIGYLISRGREGDSVPFFMIEKIEYCCVNGFRELERDALCMNLSRHSSRMTALLSPYFPEEV